MLDPRVAPGAKLLALFAIVYLLFPFDLAPDVVPVLGWLDDVGVTAMAFVLLARAWKHYRGSAAEPVSPDVIETTGNDVSRS